MEQLGNTDESYQLTFQESAETRRLNAIQRRIQETREYNARWEAEFLARKRALVYGQDSQALSQPPVDPEARL